MKCSDRKGKKKTSACPSAALQCCTNVGKIDHHGFVFKVKRSSIAAGSMTKPRVVAPTFMCHIESLCPSTLIPSAMLVMSSRRPFRS
mmetsp:Transcript_31826/g.51711  ORF Transcript_31826/g.51711 Transcript_31826/m.51711 type:complete len:87 (+) Transcript_31826:100-360(+)